MKKNIRVVLIGELVLLIAIFLLCLSNGAISSIIWFVDYPSMILIALALIPGLIIMGEWKDFVKAFSVGISHYSLLELKNIIGAVTAAQKLTVLGAHFSIISSVISPFCIALSCASISCRTAFRSAASMPQSINIVCLLRECWRQQ